MNKLLACMLVVALGFSSHPVYATDMADESNEHMEDTNAKIAYQLPEDDNTTINLANDNISSNVPKLDDLASDESQLVIPQGEEHNLIPYSLNTVTINQSQTTVDIQTVIQEAIYSANIGETVTVVGENINNTTGISIYIPVGLTVRWQAVLHTPDNTLSPTLTQLGPGHLIIDDGTSLSSDDNTTLRFNGQLTMRDGTIVSDVGSAVVGDMTADSFDMWGGTITSSSSPAISLIESGCHVQIHGGTVHSTYNSAIRIGHQHASLKISGGLITGDRNAHTVLITHGAPTNDVIVSGTGRVEARGNGNAIETASGVTVTDSAVVTANAGRGLVVGGDVTVSDSAVVSSVSGIAIRAGQPSSTVTVSGGTVSSDTHTAIMVSGEHAAVAVSGGLVLSEGPANTIENNHGTSSSDNVTISGTGRVEAKGSGDAINTWGDVTVSDSAVVTTASGHGIKTSGPDAIVTIDGGQTSSNTGNAILTTGRQANVTVSGGTHNTNHSETIRSLGQDAVITVSGGTIHSRANNAIDVTGQNAVVNISGGLLFTEETNTVVLGNTSNTTNVTISGTGRIEARGSGNAILTYGEVTVTDSAFVSATRVHAIEKRGTTATVTINGGVVFSPGRTIFGVDPVIGMNGTPTISDPAVVVAWNKAAGNTTYTAATTTDLVAVPSGATVGWDSSGGTLAVYYNGETTVPTAAGTYVVEVRISGGTGYEAAAILLGNYTIAKAAAPSITYPVATTITYGEALASAALTGGSTVHGDFTWDDGEIYPTIANSGYTVNFTPNPQTLANYEPITTLSETVAITVNKATTNGVPQTFEVVNTQAHTYSYDLTALLPDVSPRTLGTVTYNVTSVDNTDGVLATALTGTVVSPLTIDVASVADIGKTAEITITISSDNYNDFTAVLTVETVPKQTVTITADMQIWQEAFIVVCPMRTVIPLLPVT